MPDIYSRRKGKQRHPVKDMDVFKGPGNPGLGGIILLYPAMTGTFIHTHRHA